MTMSQNYLIRIDKPERPLTEPAQVPRQKEQKLKRVEETVFFLHALRGILQADVFSRYRLLFSAERQGGVFIEVPCRFHTCHKIHDVHISTKSTTTEEALKRISELYAIRYGRCRSPASERLTHKQMRSKPLLTLLYK